MDESRPAREGATNIAAEVLAVARILRAAGGDLWAQANLHGELARIEWMAEKQRMLRRLAWASACLVLAACAVLAAGAALLVLAWDTPWRGAVALALPTVYLALALLAGWRLRRMSARATPAFAMTRQELAADLALLRSRL
jgi:uncharacterized membrane protein YqjE